MLGTKTQIACQKILVASFDHLYLLDSDNSALSVSQAHQSGILHFQTRKEALLTSS